MKLKEIENLELFMEMANLKKGNGELEYCTISPGT